MPPWRCRSAPRSASWRSACRCSSRCRGPACGCGPTWRFPDGVARRARGLAGAGCSRWSPSRRPVDGHGAGWRPTTARPAALNVYQYIQAVYLLPYAVLAVPVAISAFPGLAEHVAGGVRRGGRCRAAAPASGAGPPGPPPPRRSGRPAPAAAPTAGAPTRAAPTLARSARARRPRDGARGRRAGRAAGPVAWSSPDRRRPLAARPAPPRSRRCPRAWWSFAPGLVGFGLVALLTRALYVRGRPSLAGRWVAAGWLVAALGPWPSSSAARSAAAATSCHSASASTLGMTLAAVGLVLTVRSAWGVTPLSGLPRSLAASVAVAVPSRRRRRPRRQRLPTIRPRGVRARRRARGHAARRASPSAVPRPTGTAAGCSSPGCAGAGMRVVLLLGRSTGGIGTHVDQLAPDLRRWAPEVVVVTHPLTAERFGWDDARTWWPDPRHRRRRARGCDGCGPGDRCGRRARARSPGRSARHPASPTAAARPSSSASTTWCSPARGWAGSRLAAQRSWPGAPTWSPAPAPTWWGRRGPWRRRRAARARPLTQGRRRCWPEPTCSTPPAAPPGEPAARSGRRRTIRSCRRRPARLRRRRRTWS